MGDRTFPFGANNMPGCRVWRLEHLSAGQQFLWPTRLVGGMDEWVICSAESHVNQEAKGSPGNSRKSSCRQTDSTNHGGEYLGCKRKGTLFLQKALHLFIEASTAED